MAEAANDLAFVATGAYGKPISKVQGAPIRLALPWKYGFKSAKSIVKITFVDKAPETFWQNLGPSEYGFWANVNPAVPHPRWSQASETDLTTGQPPADRDLQRLRRSRSAALYKGSGERAACTSSSVEARPAGAIRSDAPAQIPPALRLRHQEIPERLHARDVLHLLGIDEEAVHLRHVGLRQQPHQPRVRRHAIIRQHGDADAVLDGADDRREIVDRQMRAARVLRLAPDRQQRIEVVEEMRRGRGAESDQPVLVEILDRARLARPSSDIPPRRRRGNAR